MEGFRHLKDILVDEELTTVEIIEELESAGYTQIEQWKRLINTMILSAIFLLRKCH